MNITTQTIPELLVKTRGNQTEVARLLDCNRGTVAKYIYDKDATQHIIVNGRLMVDASGKGQGRRKVKV